MRSCPSTAPTPSTFTSSRRSAESWSGTLEQQTASGARATWRRCGGILKDKHKLWDIGFSMDAMLADDEFGVVKEEVMLADTLVELVRGMFLPSG